MWKLLVAFIIFAALGLYVLKQAGGDVNMGGESHDVTGGHAASAPAAPAAPASAASQ
ncbi:hypothetical protein [Pseudaquabacterium pictum]|uniref:Uncharacterized protein n=1 Tax=Pseudaquabacterium pictum TaxID=2315236 RepID=A0A480AL22_9BURK|nr:hypothetical protein [Rubrivivax pictus]GCL61686.1 hypothetical protein AQPW35_07670 [Rubrivivax pictus]